VGFSRLEFGMFVYLGPKWKRSFSLPSPLPLVLRGPAEAQSSHTLPNALLRRRDRTPTSTCPPHQTHDHNSHRTPTTSPGGVCQLPPRLRAPCRARLGVSSLSAEPSETFLQPPPLGPSKAKRGWGELLEPEFVRHRQGMFRMPLPPSSPVSTLSSMGTTAPNPAPTNEPSTWWCARLFSPLSERATCAPRI
jgi:hypothetical protein